MAVEQLRKLSPEPAAAGRPVTLRGVVTLNDQSGGVFLQDETAGIYIHGITNRNLERGTLLEVTGVSGSGRFAPVLVASNWVQLGPAAIPEPRQATLDELFSGSLDSQWIELSGVVRRARRTPSGRILIELAIARERIDVQVQGAAPGLEARLPASRVRVRGVCRSSFNDARQFLGPGLLAPSSHELVIEEEAAANPFAASPVRVNSLLQFVPDAIAGERIALRGVVTARLSSRDFYLRDESGSVHVRTAADVEFELGDVAEVVGFAALGILRPELEDALARKTGRGPLPQPREVNASELPLAESELVAVSGRLMQVTSQPAGLQFVVQQSNQLFTAWLRLGTATPSSSWREGSWLRLTGVAQSANPPRLLLRSVRDVEVIRAAPWWTLPRLLSGLALLALTVVAAFAWVISLRRRVVAQTSVIRQKVEREAVAEERARLARELHDSLEQDLAGIRLQLEAASAQLPDSAEAARHTLEVAKSMALHGQAEAKQAVQDLRPTGLENTDLFTALEQLAQQRRNPTVSIEARPEGRTRPLPARVESNLLRCAQEAVANALHHAQASRIDLVLAFEERAVRLMIRDDGRGFDPGQAPGASAGHFGLVGMRERARKLGGTLLLQPQPGQGTTVELRVPTDS